MKSYTTLVNLATNLTNNTSTANQSLAGQIIGDQHRYLIQRWFDNERTVTLSTVGGMSLTATGAISSGATSATLTAAWTYATVTQLVNFSDGEQRPVLFTNNSTSISWAQALTANVTSAITTVGVQDYAIPANVSKIKNNTINVGQLKYQPIPVETRQEWDTINFLPYTSDIPNYFFIYNGNLSIWPIPSTTGNIITFNYQTRVPDFTFSDYTTGTITAASAGSVSLTGSSTSWNTTGLFPLNTDITSFNLKIRLTPPGGDGIWYPIRQFNSDTSLTLGLPLIAVPAIGSGVNYTIGQFPLLQEDFHDMLVYGFCKTYYSSIVKDTERYKEFDALYEERERLLQAYAGTKSVNVDLGAQPPMVNPNLFNYANLT